MAMFLEVFDAGGFAPVAKSRNIAPSTISRVIAGLEAEIGVSLFDRTTRRLTPTQEGVQLEKRLRPMLGDWQSVIAELRDGQGEPSGQLKISASVSFGQAVIAPRLAAFARQFPKIELELILTDSRIDLVREGVDIAIRHGQLRDSAYIASRLCPVRYHLVASPDYLARAGQPQTLSDLTDHPHLTFSYPDFRYEWTFRKGKAELEKLALNPVLTSTSALVLRQAALDGLGIAMLPDWAIGDDGLDILMPDISVTGGHFDRAIWMMMPNRSYRARRVTAFADYLRAELRS